MSFNVEEFINRFKDRANAVKDRPMPPIGGDERMQFMKQAELDYQDYMIISDSEFEITSLVPIDLLIVYSGHRGLITVHS